MYGLDGPTHINLCVVASLIAKKVAAMLSLQKAGLIGCTLKLTLLRTRQSCRSSNQVLYRPPQYTVRHMMDKGTDYEVTESEYPKTIFQSLHAIQELY